MAEKNDSARKFDWFTLFLTVACIALAVLVVMLARENRQLKKMMEAELESHRQLPEDALKVGDAMEPFEVVDDAGGPRLLAFAGAPERTLLLVFSSTCPACEVTLPIWSEMYVEYEGIPGLEIVGIQLDRLEPMPGAPELMLEAFPFPIYGIDKLERDKLARIPYIPATVVVDANGIVEKAWFQVPDEAIREELSETLSAAAQ